MAREGGGEGERGRFCGPFWGGLDPYEPLEGSLWNSGWPKQGRDEFQEAKNEKRSPGERERVLRAFWTHVAVLSTT